MTADTGRFAYAGRQVLVTGAASGMGRATARVLTGLGAEVHALDIDEPAVDGAVPHVADLRDPGQLDRAVADVVTGGRTIDRLFNCAGLPHTADQQDVMLVNFIGLRHLTDRVIPHMPAGGAIVSVSSGAAIGWAQNLPMAMELIAQDGVEAAVAWCRAHADRIAPISAYAFSKQCVAVWTQLRALELAEGHGIRINCTLPGPTETGMTAAIVADMGQEHFAAFPKPLTGRLATPEEQAWPLIALNSDALSIVTGAVLHTDQGFGGGLLTGQVDVERLMHRPSTAGAGAGER